MLCRRREPKTVPEPLQCVRSLQPAFECERQASTPKHQQSKAEPPDAVRNERVYAAHAELQVSLSLAEPQSGPRFTPSPQSGFSPTWEHVGPASPHRLSTIAEQLKHDEEVPTSPLESVYTSEECLLLDRDERYTPCEERRSNEDHRRLTRCVRRFKNPRGKSPLMQTTVRSPGASRQAMKSLIQDLRAHLNIRRSVSWGSQ